MIYPKPRDKKTENELHRQSYELEKEGSLKQDFEEELKEDGLL